MRHSRDRFVLVTHALYEGVCRCEETARKAYASGRHNDGAGWRRSNLHARRLSGKGKTIESLGKHKTFGADACSSPGGISTEIVQIASSLTTSRSLGSAPFRSLLAKTDLLYNGVRHSSRSITLFISSHGRVPFVPRNDEMVWQSPARSRRAYLLKKSYSARLRPLHPRPSAARGSLLPLLLRPPDYH